MRTANPALSAKTFEQTGYVEMGMTVTGTVHRTAILLGLCVISAGFTWVKFYSAQPEAAMPWMIGGIFGGLIMALVTVFKKSWAPVTAPLYALLEGLFLGGISAVFNQQYPGIVFQAVVLTFGTLAALLVAYRSGLIQVTQNFRLGVVAATGGIAIFYFVAIIMNMFGVGVPILYGNGILSIAISVGIVIVAALNLVLDFDFIEQGAASGAPKYMEWYGAFGLMVTLVWLYLEILRLLAKLNSRR